MTAKRIKMHKNGGYVCAFKAHRVGRIDNTVGEVAAGNGLIWRYFEDFRELEFFGSGSLFLVWGEHINEGILIVW